MSGIIFDPIKNEMFYADKNQGTYFNNHRVRVSKKMNLEECLFATNKIGSSIDQLNCRITGSAALDLAYVSSGRFDGYFQNNLNLWDIAAGILIVKEAGGIINNIILSSHKNLSVVASSSEIYEKMIKIIPNF